MKALTDILGLAVLAWPLTLLVLIGLGALMAGVLSGVIAKKSGRSGIRWFLMGLGSVMVLVFWDWPLTVIAHQYYCEKEAGFWVYKTLEEWKAENPGVYETWVYSDKAFSRGITKIESNSRTEIHHINNRIDWVVKVSEQFPNLWPRLDMLVDSQKNEKIARYVDFGTGVGSRHEPWRFWLDSDYCPNHEVYSTQFWKLMYKFKGEKND